MTLVKWNNQPSIFEDINQWFNLITYDNNQNNFQLNANWEPNFEIIQNDDDYIIKSELAGLAKKDVNIEIDGELLKISGERKSEFKNENSNHQFHKISYGSFEKSYRLPDDALIDKISAKMDNGILVITIPTIKPVKSVTKKIKIN
ncbi:MAG: Hsp20/alpha crystallin family protein [Candidatus Marinimicrobia bacterium]|nr:Hsp20/alpha crystallin family protein [Candidatus Neomarinimicrobiota bacterium]